MDGELSRVVAGTGNDRRVSTIRRKARADQEYWVHAACSSATPGKMLSIEVQSGAPGSSGNVLATVEIACDATPTANWIGTLPAELFAVYLRGDPSDVSSAYALVAPAESLRR
ncbi:hypothetical protein BXY51_004507 [Actinoplanes cyaneus]|nr:hypothetical protein [Actinoplanes cyaneus]